MGAFLFSGMAWQGAPVDSYEVGERFIIRRQSESRRQSD